MKKSIIIQVLLVLFSQSVGAQSFLKKLGNALKESAKEILINIEKQETRDSTQSIPESYAIDLGLTVKWAKCNVGATVPEEFGNYYAFGETEPKSIYSLNTYKHYKDGKYLNIGTNISGTKYDVAHVKWGGGWRIPTIEEVKELLNKCNWNWTTYNGVNGVIITGSNGNSIFLPAAGQYTGPTLNSVGIVGEYWTASLCTESKGYNVYDLHFESYEEDTYYSILEPTTYGFLIRPVISK